MPSSLLWIVATAVALLACSPDAPERTSLKVAPPEVSTRASAGALEAGTPLAENAAPEPATQEAEVSPALAIRPPSLESLLRLPAIPALPESPPRPDITGDPTDPLEARAEHRVRLDFGTRTDGSVVPGTKRTQTDLGVSLGVSEHTRVRGGVRLEGEGGEQEREAMPTIGIERRF